MHSSSSLSMSPSFNTYSCNRLAEIAARVVEEIRAESEFEEVDDVFGLRPDEISVDYVKESNEDENEDEDDDDDDDDDDFEFKFVCKDNDSSPISADEIFYNGQIRPIFPIFNRDLNLNLSFRESENEISSVSSKPRTRLPLRKLMFEERDTPSCSSSEADDLDGISPGTYCVWTPKSSSSPEHSPGKCKKSNSTGSSKRWKFRDLLHRSNSEGKDTFVFLTPSNANSKKRREEKVEKPSQKVAGKLPAKVVAGSEGLKVAAMKEGDRRRTYLPYRQDLVGFFANVNGLSRNLHPF